MNTWMEVDAAEQAIHEDIAVVQSEVAAGRGTHGWVMSYKSIADAYFSEWQL